MMMYGTRKFSAETEELITQFDIDGEKLNFLMKRSVSLSDIIYIMYELPTTQYPNIML